MSGPTDNIWDDNAWSDPVYLDNTGFDQERWR